MTPGNIFKINHEKEVRYFQYFYTDNNYLGGDLIWVLNQKSESNNLFEIIKSGYSFCFYTTIDAGIKMKKWELVGNVEIPKEMNFYPKFRYAGTKSDDWYILNFDKKINIGKHLTEEQKKIPFVNFSFPEGAIQNMIMGKIAFLLFCDSFAEKYLSKNRS